MPYRKKTHSACLITTHTHTKRCQQLHNKGHNEGTHVHPAFYTGALWAQGTKECQLWVVVTQGYYMGSFFFYYYYYFIYIWLFIYIFFSFTIIYCILIIYLFLFHVHNYVYELLRKCTSSPSNNYTGAHTGDIMQQGPLQRRTSSPGVSHRGTMGTLNQGVSTTKWNPRATIWKHSVVY